MKQRNHTKDILLGIATGDALGVPVEFLSRASISKKPVTGIIGYGTHNQPPGTWSDDSSLTFCLAEMLCNGYDLQGLANRFINWKELGWWTPHGEVFDIGIATSAAISRLKDGVDPLLAGGDEVNSNGNGSLMRILPLVLYIKDMPVAERYQRVKEVSSLTHRHIRSVLACFIYVEFARFLLLGLDKHEAFTATREEVNNYLQEAIVCPEEEKAWMNSFWQNIDLPEEQVFSSGYVLHTLTASFWCLFQTDNYKDAVLKAVNLGEDTDTTGAVAGGLAGLVYGWETIPGEWINTLSRKEDILLLCDRLELI